LPAIWSQVRQRAEKNNKKLFDNVNSLLQDDEDNILEQEKKAMQK